MFEIGSKDGHAAADHDLPYRFGFRPSGVAPWPFSLRQYARLLVLRGRLGERSLMDSGEETCAA